MDLCRLISLNFIKSCIWASKVEFNSKSFKIHKIALFYRNCSFWIIILLHWITFNSHVNMHDFFEPLHRARKIDSSSRLKHSYDVNWAPCIALFFFAWNYYWWILFYYFVGKIITLGPALRRFQVKKIKERKRRKIRNKNAHGTHHGLGHESQGMGRPGWGPPPTCRIFWKSPLSFEIWKLNIHLLT